MVSQQHRHALNNPIADQMPEPIVVPLELMQVRHSKGAPAATLFRHEKCMQALDEPSKVHQGCLRIPMRSFRELGHDLLNMLRDVRGLRFTLQQLDLNPIDFPPNAARRASMASSLDRLESCCWRANTTSIASSSSARNAPESERRSVIHSSRSPRVAGDARRARVGRFMPRSRIVNHFQTPCQAGGMHMRAQTRPAPGALPLE